MKKYLLVFILIIFVTNNVYAYEFPFNLIKFKPHFFRMDGNHLIYKYVENLTSETLLKKNLKLNESIFNKGVNLLGIESDKRKIKLYIYKSCTQKRKMMGSLEKSQIEDRFIHVVIDSSEIVIGNILPVLASEYFGKCESIFINRGLRYIYKPIFNNHTFEKFEKVFNEYGMMRPLDKLLKNGYIINFNDEKTTVSAASFIKFLLDEYPLTFFWKWYGTETISYEKSFKEVYGFSIHDAQDQWLENLNKTPVSDEEFKEVKKILEKEKIKLD